MPSDERNILERLEHPEWETERRREDKTLFIRNILNGIFMILAVVAMVGVLVFSESRRGTLFSYAPALLAVVIKMVEVMMRMPGMMRKPSATRFNYKRDYDKRRNNQSRESDL